MSDNEPIISFIIPTKTTSENFTNLQINISRIVSKSKNIEIILVLDGDIDDFSLDMFDTQTAKIIRGYFGNPGGARNAGLQQASGDWIWFIDADDLVELDKLDTIISILSHGNADIYVGQYQHYLELEKTRHLHKELKMQGIGVDLGIWRMIFRRQILRNFFFPELSMGEDQVFVARVLVMNPRIEFLKFPIYEYWEGGSYHLTASPARRKDLLKANALISALLKESYGEKSSVLRLMYMKQLFSIIKFFSQIEKLRAIPKLFWAVIRNPKNLLYIIRTRGIHHG